MLFCTNNQNNLKFSTRQLLAIVLLSFWLADTYLKLFVFHAPARMLWTSSLGLFITSIGLFRGSSVLLTGMFCALLLPEGLWTISYIARLYFGLNVYNATKYIFENNMSAVQLYVTQYHLLLLPSIVTGLISIRKISRYGWLAAGTFTLSVSLLAYFFPDSVDNVNCVRFETIGICQTFFKHFYHLDSFFRIFLVSLFLTIGPYLAINIGLIASKKLLE